MKPLQQRFQKGRIMAEIFYRHYDMKARVEPSVHNWFHKVIPMTTAAPVYTAVMDDFGFLQRINYCNLAASLANSNY